MTKETKAYQTNAAFWLTYSLIALATAVFVVSSFQGMETILDGIASENSDKTATVIRELAQKEDADPALRVWAALEFDTLENRQDRADSLLATRTWLRFMNAAFGSILIMCGAIFILSRVRVGNTNIEAENGEFRVALASSSPGIFMLVFGAILTTTPLYVSQRIEIDDGFAYPTPYGAYAAPAMGSPSEISTELKAIMCAAHEADKNENNPYDCD